MISHIASKKDGLGYDIVSVDIDENGKEEEIFIEVKTTTGDIDKTFEVTGREVAISKKLGDCYYIYRLFNVSEAGNEVYYYRTKGAIEDNFDLEIIKYRANIKDKET